MATTGCRSVVAERTLNSANLLSVLVFVLFAPGVGSYLRGPFRRHLEGFFMMDFCSGFEFWGLYVLIEGRRV